MNATKKSIMVLVTVAILFLGANLPVVTATNNINDTKKTISGQEPTPLLPFGLIKVKGEGVIVAGLGQREPYWLPVIRIGPLAFFYFEYNPKYGGSCEIGGKSYNNCDVCCWVYTWFGFVFARPYGGFSIDEHAKLSITGFGFYLVRSWPPNK